MPICNLVRMLSTHHPFLYMVSRGEVDSVGSSEPSTGAAPTSALSSTASKSESNFVRFA